MIKGLQSSFRLWVLAPAAVLIVIVGSVIGCASGGGTDGTWGRSYSGTIQSQDGPASNVTVEMLETGVTSVTDAQGNFSLERVELSLAPITLRLVGDGLDTTVTVDAELPEADAAISVEIELGEDLQATVTEVVVAPQSGTAPTPQPTAQNSPAPTQPPASSSPTPKPSSPTPTKTKTPTPQQTPQSSPTPSNPTPTPSNTPTPSPTATPQPPPASCPGDFDEDGEVGLSDLSYILSILGKQEGEPGYDPDADFNSNDEIDNGDVTIFQGYYGTVC